jgi:hypothetical protein
LVSDGKSFRKYLHLQLRKPKPGDSSWIRQRKNFIPTKMPLTLSLLGQGEINKANAYNKDGRPKRVHTETCKIRRNQHMLLEVRIWSRVPVAHTCNPSYSGGRDQEDHSSKPDPGK